jgi:hypothetical protein
MRMISSGADLVADGLGRPSLLKPPAMLQAVAAARKIWQVSRAGLELGWEKPNGRPIGDCRARV